MARTAGLNAAPARRGLALRLLAILVVVLLVHALALNWLAHQRKLTVLQPLADPMFTRLLQPQAPAPAPVPQKKRPPAPAKRTPVATDSVAVSLPQPTVTLPVPESLPLPETVTVAPTPVEPIPDVSTLATPTDSVSASTSETSTATAALDGWPNDTRVTYRLDGRFRSGPLYGDAAVQWQREGGRYQARVDIDVSMFVRLVVTSQGAVTSAGLLPQAYEETRRGKSRSVTMDAENVLFSDGRKQPRPPGMQDTASQFVELAHRFASGLEPLEVGRSVSFWMVRPGGLDLWTYDIAEREVLKTPQLGEIEAFHLKPRPIANPRGNITAEMWFAPSLQYLPVRVRVSMGEEAMVDLLVETIEQK